MLCVCLCLETKIYSLIYLLSTVRTVVSSLWVKEDYHKTQVYQLKGLSP